MEVKLDNDAMKELVAKTIFESLTEEKKKELLQGAIQYLLTPNNERYGSKDSPLASYFKDGCGIVAKKLVEEKLLNDEALKNNIESLFHDVTKKLFESDLREKMVEKMAQVIVDNLRPKDY